MLRGIVVIEGSPKKMKGLFSNFVKAELQQIVRDWHRKILPRHFQADAHKRYNYAPRTEKYLRYKKKKHPEANDLVWSGESRRMLERSIRVSGTKRRAAGTMQAPRYFWMTSPNHPRMGEELTAVTQQETLEMAKKLNERVTKKLNMIKATEVIR